MFFALSLIRAVPPLAMSTLLNAANTRGGLENGAGFQNAARPMVSGLGCSTARTSAVENVPLCTSGLY